VAVLSSKTVPVCMEPPKLVTGREMAAANGAGNLI
jgi:hypothetical protein